MAFAAETQNRMRRETRTFYLQLLVNAVVQQRTGIPWTLGPIQLTVFARQVFFLKTLNLVERRGEYFLDLVHIHVSKNALTLITVLVEVRGAPHTRIHEYSHIASCTRKWHGAYSSVPNLWRKFLRTFSLNTQRKSSVGQRVLHVADCRVVVLSKKDEVEMECGVKVELGVTHQATVRMNET